MQKAKPTTASPRAEDISVIPNTPIRFVLFLTKQFKLLALGAISAVILAKGAELAAIYAISALIDGFNAAEGKEAQLSVLFFWGSAFVALGILDRICWRLSGFIGVAWTIKVDESAYKTLYDYVTKHSHSYFSDRFAGSISNKISHAAGNSADLIMRIMWDFTPHTISMVITIGVLTSISWTLGGMFLVVLTLVFLFNMAWVKKRHPMVVAYASAASSYRGKGVDLITNIAAARQYARRPFELNLLRQSLADKVTKDFKQSYRGEWLMVMNGIFGVILMIVILTGVYAMLEKDLATAGDLVLVLMLLAEAGYTFNIMGQMMNSFIRRYGEIQEGLEEVVIPHEIVDGKDAKELEVNGGRIDWQDVTFEFGQKPIFKDFNLSIKPGERVGLVGPSGAGKTTFVSLMLRQHDINQGAIKIDGQNIAKVTQDSLREQIAVVPQEPALFHRSLRDNIAYGNPEATDEEVIEVAKKAEAHEFISQLPEGYETLVGERGIKLSGGQRQRVAIARALLKNAPILVLDEATSALDSESEVAIQKALHELMEGKTVVAIAHRLSTLREMDRIVVLEEGQIVEDGNHETLSQGSGVYQRLWDHQAGGFLQD